MRKVFPAFETQLYKDFPENFDSGLWEKPLVAVFVKNGVYKQKTQPLGAVLFLFAAEYYTIYEVAKSSGYESSNLILISFDAL